MRMTRIALAALWLTVAAAPAFAARGEQPGRETPILQRIVAVIKKLVIGTLGDELIIPQP